MRGMRCWVCGELAAHRLGSDLYCADCIPDGCEDIADEADVDVGDRVAVHLPIQNEAGSIETRSICGHVTAVHGSGLELTWIDVEVTDGVDCMPITLLVHATTDRITVEEKGGYLA